MFVIVTPTEVRKGQAVFLGYLLSNVVAARAKAYRTEQAASAACCKAGRGVVAPTSSVAVTDSPSRVLVSRGVLC